ncbi:MAG: prepilin-type N-terminal cleavage/methylation domain-containing protein [Patescibacteria group bacterium]|jgi:prepilin-type N-terminal cleavage/methylation domain-containing protein
MSKTIRLKQGFTLIELLIIIGIIGFLASAILVAVDPVKRIQDSRNAKRWSEVNGVLNAILTKQVDDRATYDGTADTDGVAGAPFVPTIAPIITHATNAQVIVRQDPGVAACATPATKPLCPGLPAGITLSSSAEDCVANIVDIAPTYIAELPLDPTSTTIAGSPVIGDDNTGYYIHRTSGNRIEIGSCYPDQGASVKVKR